MLHSPSMASRAPVQMDSIQAVLKSALRRFGLDHKIEQYRFVEHWPKIVGAPIARHTKPAGIQNRILYVEVLNSGWAQELSMRRETILKRVKTFCDTSVQIDDVRFVLSERR